MARKDRTEKLRRLAKSPNPHEAESARAEVARLLAAQQPEDLVLADSSFELIGYVNGIPFLRQQLREQNLLPGELPGVRRIPSILSTGLSTNGRK